MDEDLGGASNNTNEQTTQLDNILAMRLKESVILLDCQTRMLLAKFNAFSNRKISIARTVPRDLTDLRT